MDNSEFHKALAKFEKKKQKRAAATLAQMDGEKTPVLKSTALPFDVITAQKPPKVKPQEAPRPKPQPFEITVTGPIELKFSIDWSGSLLGGQMAPQTLKLMFLKQLQPFGRVILK